MKKILFVDKSDVCRNPMAQALMQNAIGNAIVEAACGGQKELERKLREVVVETAGTYIGIGPDCYNCTANPFSRTCMDKRGIDIREHISRPIHELKLYDFDQIFFGVYA